MPKSVKKPVPVSSPDWEYLIGGALVAGAGVIIVATIVEDLFTLGPGIADDAPSFAVASAMFAAGMVKMKTINGGTPIQIEGHGAAPDQIQTPPGQT